MTLYTPDNPDQRLSDNGLKILQWSKTKPCQIFTVDRSNVMHIWDLEASDIYPIYSIPFKREIVQFKVLPVQSDEHFVVSLPIS